MKKIVFFTLLIGHLFLLGTLFSAEPLRKWRTKSGEGFEATWDDANDDGGDSVRLVRNGKNYKVPLAKLSEEDIKYIQDRREENARHDAEDFFGVEIEEETPEADDDEVENSGKLTSPVGEKAGERKLLTINGVEYAFHWCPAGSFMMGSPESEEDREEKETQHKVTLSHGFWMLETEVTQEMWKSVMGDNPSGHTGDAFPVEQVSWDDCQEFINQLNSAGEIPKGMKASLPSEAQWEYACRAGTSGPYSGKGILGKMGWYDDNSDVESHEVGKKSPNDWGLYDMHGNVWEWCLDWYGDYPKGSVTDPMGANSGSDRVNRGGGWISYARDCRSALRDRDDPTYRDDGMGFRLALVPSK